MLLRVSEQSRETEKQSKKENKCNKVEKTIVERGKVEFVEICIEYILNVFRSEIHISTYTYI